MLNMYSDLLPIELHNSKKEFTNVLLSKGVDKKFIDKLFNSNSIRTPKLSYIKLVKTFFILNTRNINNDKFDSNLVVFAENEEGRQIVDKPYLYDNNLKIAYIVDYSKKYYLWGSSKAIANNFVIIEKFEKKNKKSILDFTEKDMLAIVSYYRNKYINFLTYRKYISDISKFIDFCEKNFNSILNPYKRKWDYNKIVKAIPQTKNIKQFFTLKDIHDIVANEDVMQNAIVPLLIFNGVKMSKINPQNEIVKIKEQDVKDTTIDITTGNDKRKIHVDKKTAQYLSNSLSEDLWTMKYDNKVIRIPRTGYLVRPFGYNFKDGSELSEAAVQKRVRYFQHNYQEYIMDRDFNYSTLRNSGKISNIDKLLIDGYDLDEAVYLTLIKFGDTENVDIKMVDNLRLTKYKIYKLRQTYLKAKNEK